MHPYSQPIEGPMRLIANCPFCLRQYDPLQAQLLGTEGTTHIWYVSCAVCRHALMVAVLVTDGGVNSVGIVTDLQAEELAKYQDMSPVSADDCLLLHASLVGDHDLGLNL